MRVSRLLLIVILAAAGVASAQLPDSARYRGENRNRYFLAKYGGPYWAEITGGNTDFNGDGRPDLCLGIQEIGEPDRVEILLTDPYFFGMDTMSSDATLAQHHIIRFSVPGSSSDFGVALAGGDFNGDGVGDLAIGAPMADTLAGTGNGAIYILYGAESFAPGSYTLGTAAEAPRTSETLILGDDDADHLGSAMTAGDLNGDGIDDLFIAAPDGDPGGRGRAGEGYVIWGSPILPNQIIDLDTTTSGLDAVSPAGELRIFGDDTMDQFGGSSAIGDVDGDGWNDLFATSQGTADAYILYGPLTSGTLTLDTDGAIGPAGETRILGDDEGFGADGALADFDGAEGLDLFTSSRNSTNVTITILPGTSALRGEIVDLDTDAATSAWNEIRLLLPTTDSDAYRAAPVHLLGTATPQIIYGDFAWAEGASTMVGHVVAYDYPFTSWGVIHTLTSADDFFTLSGRSEDDNLGLPPGMFADFDGDHFEDAFAYAPSSNIFRTDFMVIEGDGATDAGGAQRYSPVGTGLVPPVRLGHSGVAIDYSDGDGADNGAGGASQTTLVHYYTDEHLGMLGDESETANVAWQLTTDRVGWTSASLTLSYNPDEIAGLVEGTLALCQTDDPTTNSWVQVADATFYLKRNRVTAPVTELGWFAIKGQPTGIIIDGTLDDAYGPPIAVQGVSTGFGDQSAGILMESGSELNALYMANDDEFLYVFMAGNLESNGNVMGFFLDDASQPDTGENEIPWISWVYDNWFAYGYMNGCVLPTGMNADYYFGFKFFDTYNNGTADWTFHEVDFRQQEERSTDDFDSGATTNPMIDARQGIRIGMNNANVDGVGDGWQSNFEFVGTDPALVTTGIEVAIPLDRLPDLQVGDDIRALAYVGNYVSDYLSNQFLPTMDPPDTNIGNTPLDLNDYGIGYASYRFAGAAGEEKPLNVVVTSDSPSPTEDSPIPATATFRRAVTGFEASDMVVTNATVENFQSTDGRIYTFDLVPDSVLERIEVSIPAGVAEDGNAVPNVASSGPFIRDYDANAPYMTSPLAPASTQQVPATVLPVRFSVTFSEPVLGMDKNAMDMTFPGDAGASNFYMSGSGAGPYTIVVTTVTEYGDITAAFVPGAITDTTGNAFDSTGVSATIRYMDAADVVGWMAK
ncbi:FG-GAP repeat protein [bacterium]|nr:FG-GAP repeat protein [bacterium]